MRRILIALGALAVVAVPSYAGYWFYVAGELRQGLAPWAAASRAHGLALGWRSAAVEGFPFVFRVRLSGASLAATQPLAFAAMSDEVVLTASPFAPAIWRFVAPRGATLRAPALFAALETDALSGRLDLTTGTTVELDARGLGGSGLAQGFAAETLDVSVVLPAYPPETHRDAALALTASLSQVTVPKMPAPLPATLATVALAGEWRGRLPQGPLAPALAAWRDDGGTVEIERLHVVWGTTVMDLDGTLALDEALQPTGAFTARITGADPMVDELVGAGMIEKRYADVAKSVLHAISKPDAGGDALRLPLTLQDQRLYVGPAPIAAVPRIGWN